MTSFINIFYKHPQRRFHFLSTFSILGMLPFFLCVTHCLSIDPSLSALYQKQDKQKNALLELKKQNPKKFEEWAETWQSIHHICDFRGVVCEGGTVIEVHINDAELKIVPKDTFVSFSNLKILTFFHNHLKTLDVTGLVGLEHLNASQNKLESITGLLLPKLRILDLTDNQLNSLDIGNLPSIEKVHADQNKLSELTGIHSSQLHTLNVAKNKLTSLDVSKVPTLRHLFANNNELTELNGLSSIQDIGMIDIADNPDLVVEIPSAWCRKIQTKIGSLKLDQLLFSANNTKASIDCSGKNISSP